MTPQVWMKQFVIVLDKVYKKKGKCATIEWTDTKWTQFLGDVLEEMAITLNCYVAQRRKKPKEGCYSGEYLNIDAMFISNDAYRDDENADWDPPVLPEAVIELENSLDCKKITYCLWKILCIRSPLRVLVCYQENQKKVADLKCNLEKVINERGLMAGEEGSLLVFIGNEELSESASWDEYYTVWEWDGLGQLKKRSLIAYEHYDARQG